MRQCSQVRLSAAVKRSSLCLSILLLALLLLGSPALATTPIAVDIYQDMESGSDGNVLTSAIMNASSHGAQNWKVGGGTMWVSTAFHRDLPGPVLVGGTTYNGTGGSRSWRFVNSSIGQYVEQTSSGFSEMTIACYYCPTITLTWSYGYDNICIWDGNTYGIMQTITDSSGTYFHCHSQVSPPTIGTNDDPLVDHFTSGKTYWVNLKFSSSVAQVQFAAFDPDNGYAQVGSTLQVVSLYNSTVNRSDFGRQDSHGNQSNDTNSYYFDHILFDYTNSTFPLLPSGANDTTAPSAPPVVRDGTGHQQSIAISSTQLSANWDLAIDNESGIKGYQYAIGTSQGGTNVVNWTTMKNIAGVTKTGLSLTTGQTYYFSVKAINGVGLTGPAANSSGQTVGTDGSAPSAPAAVRDTSWAYNYMPDCDETSSTNTLYGDWDPATDNESGISFYQYAFGTSPGGTNVVNWLNVPASILNDRGYSMNAWGNNLTLTPGTRYYCTVRAINNAGITGPAANSNGQICVNNSDTTPPSAPPAVRDGTGPSETSTTTSTTQLSANWDNSTDNESGISGYYYAIGTTVGGTNIVNDTRVQYNSPVTSITRTGLSLTVGQTYYFRIKAINGTSGNGLTGPATNSSGVTVVSGSDTTPPSTPPAVRDGTGADISTTVSTTQLSANWDASTDNESGISGYQYAIGTSAGGTQTLNWTTLGNVTTVTKPGLTLTVGQTYFFSVKAVNNAGLTGSATNSNGQTVVTDSTPPSPPPAVRDGTGTDISTTTSTTQLSANWDASTDNESGISGYQYAIGTSAGGTQTVNWTSLGNVLTVTKTGLTLTLGQTYFFSVKAVNGAGLTGSATNSNGQTVVAVTNVVYFSDNFENWAVHGGAWSSVNGESSTHTLNTSTDYAKAGSKCLKTTDTDTTATTGASLTKNFSPVISGDIYVRFFVFLPTGFGSVNSTCVRRIVRVYTNTGSYTVITLTGDNLYVQESGGWSGTGTTAISENAWHCVELHVAPPSASTAIQYWIDGTSAGTLTGAFSGASTFNSMMFGDVALATSGTTNDTGTIYWDEVVVSNFYNGTNVTTTYFSDNFENWTVHGGAWSSVSGENVNHSLNTSTDYARAGTKSLKLTDTETTGTYGACLVESFSPTISNGIYVRFYVYLPTAYVSANTGGASRRLLRVFCGTNRGQWSVANGATPVMEEIGAWGASTAPSALSADAWHCVEMYMATPSASTAMQYWIDGTSTGTLTGSFSGSTSYDRIEFGDVSVGAGTNCIGTFYLDEVIVSDSYNGTLP